MVAAKLSRIFFKGLSRSRDLIFVPEYEIALPPKPVLRRRRRDVSLARKLSSRLNSPPMANFPKQLEELIERFERNIESYSNQAYNETQVRREFIDPFFEALGWDVASKSGYAEAYKDVIHEDAIKIGGATKAPDYCFRIGGARKFFLEAKKPAVISKRR